MTEQNPWANIPPQYEGRWGYDYDENLSTFFVHCGGHHILDAEDSEVAHAVCLAHNTYHPRPTAPAAEFTYEPKPAPAAGGLSEDERDLHNGAKEVAEKLVGTSYDQIGKIILGLWAIIEKHLVIDRLAASPGGDK